MSEIGSLPPVQWVKDLGLWDLPPFTWLGSLAELQVGAAQIVGGAIFCVIAGVMFLELLYFWWSWYRGAQIKYDPVKAVKWVDGPLKGQRRNKPVNLEVARSRRYAWPLLGLPLYLVAVGMFAWCLVLWPSMASFMFMGMLWFVFAPVRRVWFIRVARKAYRANNADAELTTTLWDDVYNYYYTGVARPEETRRNFEPSFVDTGWISRRLIWGEKVFGKYGTFWRIWRFWNILRFWGVLIQMVLSFFWPITAAVAPFTYMKGVEDYQKWMNPWWRRYRDNEYLGGTVVEKDDQA